MMGAEVDRVMETNTASSSSDQMISKEMGTSAQARRIRET
jgi:hypothetical protein